MLALIRRLACAALVAAVCAAPLRADDRLPQFRVEASWPKPLPNNWILGQVAGIATDKYDHIWIVHRPLSLNARELAAAQNPPEAKCCVAAPPVLEFDVSGNLLRHWGGAGAGYQWPESEHGIFIDLHDRRHEWRSAHPRPRQQGRAVTLRPPGPAGRAIHRAA